MGTIKYAVKLRKFHLPKIKRFVEQDEKTVYHTVSVFFLNNPNPFTAKSLNLYSGCHMLKSPDKAEEQVGMSEEKDRATSADLFATRRPRRKQGSLRIF